MNDDKLEKCENPAEILAKHRESKEQMAWKGAQASLSREADRYFSKEHEAAFGVGVVVFDKKIRLSPMAKALLTLVETRKLPQKQWFDPEYPEVMVSVRNNQVDQQLLAQTLASLLPASTGSSISSHRSAESIMGDLKEHGVPISPELHKVFSETGFEEVDDLLMGLKADSDSNICLVHFMAAIKNETKGSNYADGYVMRLTDTVSQYSSLEDLSRNGTDLDLALSLGDEAGVERILCAMIQDIFLCIKHPAIRAYFSERLLNGRARESLARAIIPSQAAKDRQALH